MNSPFQEDAGFGLEKTLNLAAQVSHRTSMSRLSGEVTVARHKLLRSKSVQTKNHR